VAAGHAIWKVFRLVRHLHFPSQLIFTLPLQGEGKGCGTWSRTWAPLVSWGRITFPYPYQHSCGAPETTSTVGGRLVEPRAHSSARAPILACAAPAAVRTVADIFSSQFLLTTIKNASFVSVVEACGANLARFVSPTVAKS
jgi:hypothetical protein